MARKDTTRLRASESALSTISSESGASDRSKQDLDTPMKSSEQDPVQAGSFEASDSKRMLAVDDEIALLHHFDRGLRARASRRHSIDCRGRTRARPRRADLRRHHRGPPTAAHGRQRAAKRARRPPSRPGPQRRLHLGRHGRSRGSRAPNVGSQPPPRQTVRARTAPVVRSIPRWRGGSRSSRARRTTPKPPRS